MPHGQVQLLQMWHTWQEKQGTSEVITRGNNAGTGNVEGKNAHKAKFRVNLNHSDFTGSVWPRQGWELQGEAAAAAPAEPAKGVAAAVLTQGKDRESSRSRGENGRAQRDLGKKYHCQFSQRTFRPENTGNNCTRCSPPQNRASFIPANMNTLGKRIIEKNLEGFRKRKIL